MIVTYILTASEEEKRQTENKYGGFAVAQMPNKATITIEGNKQEVEKVAEILGEHYTLN